MSTDDTSILKCPTCGASQAWSGECRRCKCDLSLLVQTLRQRQALHRAVLRELRDGRHDEAIEAALVLCTLTNDDDAERLLAVCYLSCGRFAEALAVHDRVAAR